MGCRDEPTDRHLGADQMTNICLDDRRLAGVDQVDLRLIGIDPDHSGARYGLGSILREKGDLEGAVGQFAVIPRKAAEFSVAQDTLGDIFEEMGDSAIKNLKIVKAIRNWRKSIRIRRGVSAQSNKN